MAIDIDMVGAEFEERTRLTSRLPSPSQRSTLRTYGTKSTSLGGSQLGGLGGSSYAPLLWTQLTAACDVFDDQFDARWGCYRPSILETIILEAFKAPANAEHTLSPKPHIRARSGCCRTIRLFHPNQPLTFFPHEEMFIREFFAALLQRLARERI